MISDPNKPLTHELGVKMIYVYNINAIFFKFSYIQTFY